MLQEACRVKSLQHKLWRQGATLTALPSPGEPQLISIITTVLPSSGWSGIMDLIPESNKNSFCTLWGVNKTLNILRKKKSRGCFHALLMFSRIPAFNSHLKFRFVFLFARRVSQICLDYPIRDEEQTFFVFPGLQKYIQVDQIHILISVTFNLWYLYYLHLE